MTPSIWRRSAMLVAALGTIGTGFAHAQTIARHPLNEGQGTVAVDTSGNGHQATISGAAWVQGRCGTALSFNGIDNYAITDTPLTFARNAPLTITAWVRATGYPAAEAVIVAQAETAFSFNPRIWLSATGHVEAYYSAPGAAAALASDPDPFLLNAWTHVAVTWAYPVLRVYVNGTLKAQADGSAIPDTTTVNPLLIGATILNAGGINQFFNGWITRWSSAAISRRPTRFSSWRGPAVTARRDRPVHRAASCGTCSCSRRRPSPTRPPSRPPTPSS